jgi:hypothetical protein
VRIWPGLINLSYAISIANGVISHVVHGGRVGGDEFHGLSSWLRVKYTDQGAGQAAAIFARSRVGHDAPWTWCVVASPGASLAAARRGAFPARWRNIAFGPLFC